MHTVVTDGVEFTTENTERAEFFGQQPNSSNMIPL
jgi:hypothetical protein